VWPRVLSSLSNLVHWAYQDPQVPQCFRVESYVKRLGTWRTQQHEPVQAVQRAFPSKPPIDNGEHG